MNNVEVCKLLGERMISEGCSQHTVDSRVNLLVDRCELDECILQVSARLNSEYDVEIYSVDTGDVLCTISEYFEEYNHYTSNTAILVGLMLNEEYDICSMIK